MANLKELKDEQHDLREQTVDRYKKSGVAIATLAKDIGLSYFCLRWFMMGKNIGYKNIFKIKEWLSK